MAGQKSGWRKCGARECYLRPDLLEPRFWTVSVSDNKRPIVPQQPLDRLRGVVSSKSDRVGCHFHTNCTQLSFVQIYCNSPGPNLIRYFKTPTPTNAERDIRPSVNIQRNFNPPRFQS